MVFQLSINLPAHTEDILESYIYVLHLEKWKSMAHYAH